MRRTIMILAAVVLAVAGACGGDQEVVAGPGGPSEPPGGPSGGAGGPSQAAGPLVVSVEVGGGFLMPGQDFRTVPQAVVYADGTTYAPGAMIAIYPGAALPAVIEGHVDDDVVDRLVEAATEAGLADDEEDDFGDPPVADAATTTVTVVVDGTVHTTSVYALDVTGAGVGPGAGGEGIPGLTAEQRQARDRVAGFVDLVSSVVVDSSGEQYVAERYRVLPLAPDLVDPAVEPDTRDWPLPEVELQEGVCTAVEGVHADEVRDDLEAATEITRWRTDDGQVFVLSVRPVLPHEPTCPV